MRDMGACQSPQNAFLTNVGLETLHLRVERHCRNAEKVAEFLKNHPKVAWVEYAGLADSKYHALAEKYMPNGTCGVLCFGPKGGRDGAMRFTNGLKMVAIVTRCRCKKLRSAPGKPYPPPAERSAAHRSRCSAGSDPSVGRH